MREGLDEDRSHLHTWIFLTTDRGKTRPSATCVFLVACIVLYGIFMTLTPRAGASTAGRSAAPTRS